MSDNEFEVVLLNVREAAHYVRLSPNTLNSKRSSGSGPRFVKLGGRAFYRRSDLDAWIEQRAFDCTAAARAVGSQVGGA